MSRTIVQDMKRCIGCLSCQVLCKSNKNLSPGPKPCQIMTIGPVMRRGKPHQAHIFLSCFHCQDAACVKACPSGAMRQRPEDGLVYVERDECIGCQSCILACPWGAPQWDPVARVVVKCDLCKDRIDQGLEPACVTSCTSKALSVARVWYQIDMHACKGCGCCTAHCPVGAISGDEDEPHEINTELCITCGECFRRCRFDAVTRMLGDKPGEVAPLPPEGHMLPCSMCGAPVASRGMIAPTLTAVAGCMAKGVPAVSGLCPECSRKRLAQRIAGSRFAWA